MNVHQIEVALSQKISAASTNFDLLAASKALQLLRTNGVFVVSTAGNLPSATSNEGKIYFIEDIETVVWSNGTNWLRLLDKTLFTQLWAWGIGSTGRIGDGVGIDRCSPVREFCSATDWCQVSTGTLNTIAVKTSGQLWSWGGNGQGELGDGTTTNRLSPVREFCSAIDWCYVNAAVGTAVAIKTSGELWSWGCNLCGGIGDGTVTTSCSPVREICSATDWCQAGLGNFHTAAIKTSGQLWAWGCNRCGALGDGTLTSRCSPVREICSATDWCQASAGSSHTVALKTSGQLWVWGSNRYGKLGDGTTVTRCSPVRDFCSATDWCQVGNGVYHIAAIKTSGELWAWGQNNLFGFIDIGVIGDGTITNRCSPVREFCSATDWCQVSANSCHTAAVKTTGQIWSWGCNNFRLGTGTDTGSCSPVREFCSATDWCQVSAGNNHTAALKVL